MPTNNQRAYILIKAHPQFQREILKDLSLKLFTKYVNIVFGSYDIIVVVEAQTSSELGKIVLEEISVLSGIEQTVTLLAIPLET